MNSRINSSSCAVTTRPRYFHSPAAIGHHCDKMETGTQGLRAVVETSACRVKAGLVDRG